MKKTSKLLAMLLTICLLFTLFPAAVLAADGITTREGLIAALDSVEPGGTVTLAAAISGDPINVNSWQKTFKIDRTSANFAYPKIIGYYSAGTNYYMAYGYGAEGVTMSHTKAAANKVETYTYAPVDDAAIAAYVTRTDASATSAAYACTTLDYALARVSSPYSTHVHLKKDFTGTAATTKSTAFTLFPDGHAATGEITYSGTLNYDVITQTAAGGIGVSFKLISVTAENGGVTKRYGASEFADAAAYANSCTGDTTLNILSSITLSEPVELDENVTLNIASGATLELLSDFVSNGPMVNSGKISFHHGASLTAPTASALGTATLRPNYEQTSSVTGDYTVYGVAADSTAEVEMKLGDGEYENYSTLKYALDIAGREKNEGKTAEIKLRKSITAEKTQKITNCTLDLNGYTLSTAANSYLNVSDGDAVFTDTSYGKTGRVVGGSSGAGRLFSTAYKGNLTLEAGTFEYTGGIEGAAINAFGRGSTASFNSTVIEIKSGATVISNGTGIMIEKAASNASYAGVTANIYGKIEAADFAVYINGGVSDSATAVSVINVYDGAELTSTDGVAIFGAGYARWNISGGLITGLTGIYIKSGVLNVTGGEIGGAGPYAEPTAVAGGCNSTGDAVVADSCGYPGGAPAVSISGGVLTGAYGYALRECQTSGTLPVSQLLVSGGSFKGASGKLIASTLGKFITGGKFSEAPEAAQIADGYAATDSDGAIYTKLVARADAAAKIGDKTYATLAAAVNAARSGETVVLLRHSEEAVVVSKALTVSRNYKNAVNLSAGEGFVLETTPDAYTITIAPTAEVVLSESVDAGIGENVPQEDAAKIAAVIDQTQITGVADAVKPSGAENIIASAGVDIAALGEDDVVEVGIDVAVEVTEADLAAGTLTFNVDVSANVKVNGSEEASGIPVANSALDGSPIELLLPLPAGFVPEEIIHIHDNSTRDRFLEKTANPGAKKQFEIVAVAGQSFAKLCVTGFSGLQMNMTPTVIAKIGSDEYGTLQEAVNAAKSGQTIVLQDDCDEAVTVDGKTITIDRGGNSYGAGKVTIGSRCAKTDNGAQITISYYNPLEIEPSRLYDITAEQAAGGNVSAGRRTAPAGREVMLRIKVEAGYTLLSVRVTDEDGEDVKLVENDGEYSFAMPASDVTVEAKFKSPMWEANPFTDVSGDDEFCDAVRYLYEKGIMEGTGTATFEPHTGLDRAMMATMLWRAEGKPAAAKASSFKDVPGGTWYTEAVAWAAGAKLVEGYGDGNFGPEDRLTNEQMLTLLYRYSAFKGAEMETPASLARFRDAASVSSWALEAVRWACGNGVLETDEALLSPEQNCERADAAFSLAKLLEKLK